MTSLSTVAISPKRVQVMTLKHMIHDLAEISGELLIVSVSCWQHCSDGTLEMVSDDALFC